MGIGKMLKQIEKYTKFVFPDSIVREIPIDNTTVEFRLRLIKKHLTTFEIAKRYQYKDIDSKILQIAMDLTGELVNELIWSV